MAPNPPTLVFMDKDTLGAHFIMGSFAAQHDTDPDAINLDELHLTNSFDYVISDIVLHVLSQDQQVGENADPSLQLALRVGMMRPSNLFTALSNSCLSSVHRDSSFTTWSEPKEH